MKKCLMLMWISLLALISLTATADWSLQNVSNAVQPKRLYIRASAGFPTYRRVDTDGIKAKFKAMGNVAVGWNCSKHISAEIEGGYFKLPFKVKTRTREYGSKVKSFTALLNLIAHSSYALGSNIFKPFIGAGAGYINNTTDDLIGGTGVIAPASTKTGRFVYQLFLGVECVVRPELSLVLDARWIDVNKSKWKIREGSNAQEFRLQMQTITVGAKFNF